MICPGQTTGYRDTTTRGAKLFEPTTTRGAAKHHEPHNVCSAKEHRVSTTFCDANGHRIPPASPRGLTTIHSANCTDGATSTIPGAAIAAAAPGLSPRELPWPDHSLDWPIWPKSSNPPAKRRLGISYRISGSCPNGSTPSGVERNEVPHRREIEILSASSEKHLHWQTSLPNPL